MIGAVPLARGSEFAGEFLIEQPLSHGGMGAVYIATQRSTGRRRALKLMHGALAADAKARERFVREARIGAAIQSAHVVEVIDAGVDAQTGAPWLAMELLEGQDLSRRLRQGSLGAAELSSILEQVCHALAAAHAAGVVHRDIKPENIFLCRSKSVNGELSVKVLDFGIAALAEESGAGSTGFVGTPAFMAPEQTRGGAITPATDVWALGLLAFRMLTDWNYWRSANSPSPTPMQILTEIATDSIEPASVRAATLGAEARIPAGFDAWFARAVAREPSSRFPSAAEAWAALQPLLGKAGELDVGMADTFAGAGTATPRVPGGTPEAQQGSADDGLADTHRRARVASTATPRGSEHDGLADTLQRGTSPPRVEPTATPQRAEHDGLADTLQRGTSSPRVAPAATPQRAEHDGRAEDASPASAATPNLPEHGSADALQRRPGASRGRRMPLTIAATALVVAGIGTTAAISLRSRETSTPPAAVPISAAPDRFKVPLGDSPARGATDPLVTVVVFGDFQCPFTRMANERLRTLLAQNPNDLRVVFKHYPLGLHPSALAASRLTLAARETNGDDGFWKAHDALLGAQEKIYAGELNGMAKELGLDDARARAALADEKVPDAILNDIKLAETLGVTKTPTIFVNGKRHEGSDVFDEVKAELASARAKVSSGSRQGLYESFIATGAANAPKDTLQLPKPPPSALERGQSGKGIVDVYYFGTYNDLIAILAEPSVEHALNRFEDRIHLVFWDIADPSDAEAFEIAAAVHSSAGNGWKMHDEIFKRQYDSTWKMQRQPLTRDALRKLAIELGVDAAAYDYELRTQAPDRVRSLWRAAKDAGISERSLFIDGERFLVSAPTVQLELAIENALAKRSQQ